MIPTEYEFQRIAETRGLGNQRNQARLEAGFEGEEKLYRYLKEFGSKHWVVLRNVWLKDDNDFECDLLVITGCSIYEFEVKNYFGTFIYENGQSYSRGVAITYNPINQARNARLHLQNLLPDYSVKGVLAFMGEHNPVEIRDAIEDIQILACNEIYDFILKMKQTEQQHPDPGLHADEIVAKLEKLAIQPPYLSEPYTSKQMRKARTGIFCAHCQQKVAVSRHHYIKCLCGFCESREEAIVRTACDYGVLTYGSDFTVREIYNFLGQAASLNYTRIILQKHFDCIPNAKVLTFENPNLEYTKVADQFTFRLPKMRIY